MKITKENFGKNIDKIKVPDLYKEDISEFKKLTNGFTDWSIYKDATVKEWVDLVIDGLNEANKEKKAPAAKKPSTGKAPKAKKTPAKPAAKKKKATPQKGKTTTNTKKPAKKKAPAKRKTAKKTTTKKPKALNTRTAPKTGVANKIIKKFGSCINRRVHPNAIVNLVAEIKEAHAQLQSIKGTQHYTLIERIYKQLVPVVNNLPKDAGFIKVEVSGELLAMVKGIVHNQEPESMKIQKAFIRMEGRKIMPITARRLRERVVKELSKKGSNKSLSLIKSELDNFLNGKQDRLKISKATLDGLGCAPAKSMSGTTAKKKARPGK